jgi:flagellar hook-length control protein FliK
MTPVGSSSAGGDSTAAAAAASSNTSVLAGFQAAPADLGTTTDESASDDSDPSGGAQSSPDRARASADLSSGDLSTLAQLVRGVSAGNAQTGGVERSIGTPVSDPGWSRDVAAQVQMMASAKVQSATLRLSPEHLGPVEVHIDMQASQINVSFVAAHPDTRSALEQSVPMLRAMLAHGGLTLGQTQVQGEARSGSHSTGGRAHDNAMPAPGEEPMTVAAVRGAGLIDEYA